MIAPSDLPEESKMCPRLDPLEPRRLLSFSLQPLPSEGSIIVFQSNRNGNYDLYRMFPDGSHIVNITNNPATDAIPQVSDDGTKVAFASDRGHAGNMDIWLMNTDGSHLVNITHNNLPGASNWDPAPSPDNSKVLYMGPCVNGGYDIWVSDADGTHPRNLTNGLNGDFASWSDDGSKIVFGSDRDSTNNEEIYWMNADGTNVHRVTNSPGRDTYPAFNHDATRIAFTTERTGNREIFDCKLDGTDLRNFTNSPNSTDQVPYYSPEGDEISFNSDRDGNTEVYIMNADGSHQHRITNDPANDVYPGWGEFKLTVAHVQLNRSITGATLLQPKTDPLDFSVGSDY